MTVMMTVERAMAVVISMSRNGSPGEQNDGKKGE
jgi:hypothetical protein